MINTGRNAGWCLQLQPGAGLCIAVCWTAASHRALEDLPSAGKMGDICAWWRKENVYPAKLQTFNPGDFGTGHGELTSTFPRFSSILMDVVGSSAGGDFKYSTHVTSCSQEIHFFKAVVYLWWCWCLHNAHILHLLQPLHTVVPSLSLRPQALEKVTFWTHDLCLTSVFSIHHTVSQTCQIAP